MRLYTFPKLPSCKVGATDQGEGAKPGAHVLTHQTQRDLGSLWTDFY